MSSPAHKAQPSAAISCFLKNEAKKAQHPLSLSIALSFASGLLLIVQMGLLAHIITQTLTEKTGLDDQALFLALLPPVFIVRAGISYLAEKLALDAATEIKHKLRKTLLARLIARGPITDRQIEESSGISITMLTDGIEALQNYFARYLPAMVMMVILPLAILAVTLPLDWLSALVMVVTAPLIPFFMILIGKGTERLNQKQWRKLARLSAHFLDMIQGLTTLKLFNASRREAEMVSKMADDYRRTTMSVLRVAFLSSLVLEFFSTLSIALIAVFIGFKLLYGHIDFYNGLYVLLLAPDFYLPLRQMGTHYHARLEAIGAAETMTDLMHERVETKPTLPQLSIKTGHSISIEFRNVSYSYSDGTKALQDVSFSLKAGESMALVGQSGSGKSTLMDLILGLIIPDQGQILINGVDLIHLPIEEWRKHLAYIPQQPVLFEGTIKDAIRYGKPHAKDGEIKKAAEAAQLGDFINNLEAGYDHETGEAGKGLSGGQIQRLAIARAILCDAPLILLDEPSAHLDRENEQKVLLALDNLARSATSITIAHRLHTICKADRILVLNKGRLVEDGTHLDLITRQGPYAHLVENEFTFGEAG